MTDETINKTLKRNILLNPGPATTSPNVKRGLLVSDICPRENDFSNVLYEVLDLCKKVVTTPAVKEDYQTILIGGSGTAAIESVITSVQEKEQTLLILENGAYGKRIAEIARTHGIAHEVLSFPWGDPLDYQKIEDYLGKNREKFSALAVIHHETTSGVLNDLTQISNLCQKFELTSIVDAMSSYAGIEINLEKTPVSYLISSSNKCIQGMAGLGIIIANKEDLKLLKNKTPSSFYLNLYTNYLSQVEKGQFQFTPPVQILFALKEALDEFFREGAQNRAQRYQQLYEQMLKGMKEIGFTPLVEEKHHSKLLTAFIGPKDNAYSFDDMHDHLYERGVTIYPGKGAKKSTFRVSNIGQLNMQDISYFLDLMKNYIHSRNITLTNV